MKVESQISALFTSDDESVKPRLAALLDGLAALSPADVAPFVPKLCQQIVESRSPQVASSIAVAVGALVEDGAAGRHAQSSSTADVQASAAYESLDLWWRAAVAAWSRAPQFIPRAKLVLKPALQQLERDPGEAAWLLRICATSVDEPFVFLFPELREAHQCTVSGVSLTGQLSILLSRALAGPLRRIGATAPADSNDDSYGCSFRLYPWQALDRQSGLPIDGKFRWKALSGWGTH